jgi:hypothetical protein
MKYGQNCSELEASTTTYTPNSKISILEISLHMYFSDHLWKTNSLLLCYLSSHKALDVGRRGP